MKRVRFLVAALGDLARVERRSAERFGQEAQGRYRLLIAAALRDLLDDPARPGVRPAPGRRPTIRLYPIRFSRARLPPVLRVGAPRHVLVFRDDEDALVILALLDEQADLPNRLRRR